MAQTRKHYSLTQNQLHLLLLLYKFRFLTIPLLTTYKNLTSNSLQRTFDILLAQQYVERRFEVSYKIDRKPAIYYLTAKGIAVLKADDRFNPLTLHAYYKNRFVSDAFMQHVVDTLSVYNVLRQSYGDRFDMFTRQEIAHIDDFPATKPDLYLRGSTEYFVTLAHDTQLYLIRKRLAEYTAHFEEDGWINDEYPTLLFIFTDERTARRFRAFAGATLETAGIGDDELRIGTATLKALHETPPSPVIWTFAGDTRTQRRLTALLSD